MREGGRRGERGAIGDALRVGYTHMPEGWNKTNSYVVHTTNVMLCRMRHDVREGEANGDYHRRRSLVACASRAMCEMAREEEPNGN